MTQRLRDVAKFTSEECPKLLKAIRERFQELIAVIDIDQLRAKLRG
jgi:hypothetical protein